MQGACHALPLWCSAGKLATVLVEAYAKTEQAYQWIKYRFGRIVTEKIHSSEAS